MNPKISIIIPIYNVEKYIEECLQSVLMQDYDNLEIILIDDDSKDQSINICKNVLIASNHKIKFIKHTKNCGLSVARNTGINSANGDYLIFIDSDDYLIGERAISKLLAKAIKTNADVVSANNIMIEDQTKLVRPHSDNLYQDSDSVSELNSTAWNKLVKTSFIKNNDLIFEDGILHEDDLWCFKLMHSKPAIATISDVTYAYRVRNNSIMTAFGFKHIYSRIRIADILYEYLAKIQATDIMQDIIMHGYNSLAISYLGLKQKDVFKRLFTKYRSRHTQNISLSTFIHQRGRKLKLLYLIYILPSQISIHYIKLLIRMDAKVNKGLKKFRNPIEISPEEMTHLLSTF